MKTDDLIRALATDGATPRVGLERALVLAVLPGIAVAAVLFAVLLGPRPDLAQVAGNPGFLFKLVVTLTLAATASWLLMCLARPGVDSGAAAVALFAAPVIVALVAGIESISLDPAARAAKLIGTSWPTCLIYIPLISLPVLAAVLIGMRHGASTRPALAGLVAGLVAGGFGAAIYAVYCQENSALFLATWYSLGILIVAALGAVAGNRLLRW
jgi:hypothetical protein